MIPILLGSPPLQPMCSTAVGSQVDVWRCLTQILKQMQGADVKVEENMGNTFAHCHLICGGFLVVNKNDGKPQLWISPDRCEILMRLNWPKKRKLEWDS